MTVSDSPLLPIDNRSDSNSRPLVFVYGTLMPGGHYWESHCQGKGRNLGAARVRGRLYDLHCGYPGLRLGGDSWVSGYILEITSKEAFKKIDELEGYDPARPPEENEYIRLLEPCFDPEGRPLGQAWTYEITESELKRCGGRLVESGIWPPGCSDSTRD